MKLSSSFKSYVIGSICYASSLLFIYAAASKMLDFENFQVQLGQSPMISAFAVYVSYAVPITEIIIGLLLISARGRLLGLLLFYGLMAMFTSYIYIILNYSSYVPCSCGGLLESLSWKEHLLFNLVFMVLSSFGIYGLPSKNSLLQNTFRKSVTLIVISLASFGFVFSLYTWSEKIIQYNNTFIRRFPPHAAPEIYKIDLKYNSYYIAGSGSGQLYLGNHTTPLVITAFDTLHHTLKTFKIDLAERHLSFRSPQIKVLDQFFFVYEGSIPYLFKGKTEDWKARMVLNSGRYFSQFQPVDSLHLLFRYLDDKTGENVLGKINLTDTNKVVLNKQLLQKQMDGIFDTDGQLMYSTTLKKLIYTYRYRNQFVLANGDLNFTSSGTTIDTVTKAQIQLQQVKSRNYTTFARPPLVVNRLTATDAGLLFVNSALPGRFEDAYLWKNASIIDVYNLTTQSYRSSFPIYHVGGEKMKSFTVLDKKIYALIENQLVCYKLLPHLNAFNE